MEEKTVYHTKYSNYADYRHFNLVSNTFDVHLSTTHLNMSRHTINNNNEGQQKAHHRWLFHSLLKLSVWLCLCLCLCSGLSRGRAPLVEFYQTLYSHKKAPSKWSHLATKMFGLHICVFLPSPKWNQLMYSLDVPSFWKCCCCCPKMKSHNVLYSIFEMDLSDGDFSFFSFAFLSLSFESYFAIMSWNFFFLGHHNRSLQSATYYNVVKMNWREKWHCWLRHIIISLGQKDLERRKQRASTNDNNKSFIWLFDA